MITNLTIAILLSASTLMGSIGNDTTLISRKANAQDYPTINFTESYNNVQSYTNVYTNQGQQYCESYIKYKAQQNSYLSYSNISSFQYSYLEMYNSYNPDHATLTKVKTYTIIKALYYSDTLNHTMDLAYNIQVIPPQTAISPDLTCEVNIYSLPHPREINDYWDMTNISQAIQMIETELPDYTLEEHNANVQLLNSQTANTYTAQLGNYVDGTLWEQSFIVEIVQTDTHEIYIEWPSAITTPQQLIIPNTLHISYQVIPGNTYEVVDIPGLMLYIVTLPFAFISWAFGPITLFPNTPYQINIGNLIMVIITVLMVIWIIRKIIKIKG